MTEFTKEDWQRFSLRPWEFVGRKVSCALRAHPMSLDPYVTVRCYGVIAKKTKSNMVGVVMRYEKNITSFAYRDLAWEDESE